MERTYVFQVVLKPDLEVGGYTVNVPSLPGCITEGDTVEEALTNAKEAIQLWIEDALEHGELIPSDMAVIRIATPEPVPDDNPILVTSVAV